MQNRQYTGSNKRQHYRIRYPLACRPRLKILDHICEVIDISEHGIRFVSGKVYGLQPEMAVEAVITFNDGESLRFGGKILRIDENVAVMYLSESIPFRRIVAEQRYLKEEYPEYR